VLYQHLLRPILFSLDPEWLHTQTLQFLHWVECGDPALGRTYPALDWFRDWLTQNLTIQDSRLKQQLFGVTFENPVGLAPGFDKDGRVTGLWSSLGFGFAELGTVTHQPQPGNSPPRLFRLPQDQAIINRMGFNNQGAASLATRLQQSTRHRPLPLGINIGKSKVTPLAEAPGDYLASFQQLQPWGDYFVVNVSSPNTPGLRSLQDRDQLEPILDRLQEANQEHKPLLVKISPDLDWEAIANVLNLVQQYQLAGVVATNTTVDFQGLKTRRLADGRLVTEFEPFSSCAPLLGRPIRVGVSEEGREASRFKSAGGLSGAPLRQRSTAIIRRIWQHTQGQVPIIGVGGIFTAEDAWEKITAGASLVQLYTGLIYEGPWVVRRILAGLLEKLEQHNLSNLSEAVGLEHRTF